jgi:hypothetical protein
MHLFRFDHQRQLFSISQIPQTQNHLDLNPTCEEQVNDDKN